MGNRHLMAGEWIGPHDGLLHGPYACECHGNSMPRMPYYPRPNPEESPLLAEVRKKIKDIDSQLCERCRKKVLDPLCPSCLEMALREEEAR